MIVAASKTLPGLRFAITAGSQITATGQFDVSAPITPDFLFYPLMLFLQEARPFMRLIGQYL